MLNSKSAVKVLKTGFKRLEHLTSNGGVRDFLFPIRNASNTWMAGDPRGVGMDEPERGAIVGTFECPWCGSWETDEDGRWRSCRSCGCSWRMTP
jgi:hypothetical protein